MILTQCDDDEKPKSLPEVTTGITSDITTESAAVTGEIVSNGNDRVTIAGFVYSSAVAMPTTADDKIEVGDIDGQFSTVLTNLASGTTYRIRAFATNSIGTAYGNVVEFATGNAPPAATNVTIAGDLEVNKEILVMYTYIDSEGDLEQGTVIRLYMATDATGLGETVISEGTTGFAYTLPENAQGMYLSAGVLATAATGVPSSSEIRSPWVGAVGEATTVTFTYNGQEVVYGIIASSVTGKKWLDRNLGASSSPGSMDDYANYGDLFQWGRLADGHQLILRSGLANEDISAVNGTTSTTYPYQISESDEPGHSLFIVNGEPPADWRVPQNDNLWQRPNNPNNPCPAGWRIPTQNEFADEGFSNLETAFNTLRITATGQRLAAGDGFGFSANGYYWTSTMDNTTTPTVHRSVLYVYRPTNFGSLVTGRTPGYACRCIRDQ